MILTIMPATALPALARLTKIPNINSPVIGPPIKPIKLLKASHISDSSDKTNQIVAKLLNTPAIIITNLATFIFCSERRSTLLKRI